MREGIPPKFSVIIAVYNGEKTLARAIDSVLKQSVKTYELIVVDDGSTDGTASIAKQYGNQIRYCYQNNAGVSAARNKGVQIATGDWVAFLDADDWYYPDRIKLHSDWIQEDNRLDFLTGNFDYVKPDGSKIRSSLESNAAGRLLLENANGERATMTTDIIEKFIAHHFGDTHTLSVPRKIFMQLDGYPTGFAVCEDVNFLIRLTAQSKTIGVITTPLAAYAIYENSATRSNPLRAQQQTLAALQVLRPVVSESPDYIQKGLEESIRHARRDLAYVLLREKKRVESIRAIAPLLWENPGMQSVRDFLSILKG